MGQRVAKGQLTVVEMLAAQQDGMTQCVYRTLNAIVFPFG
jgi:hypothetical protein